MSKAPLGILSVTDRRALESDLIPKIEALRDYLANLKEVSDWDLSYGQQDSFSLEVRNQTLEDCDQSDRSQLSIRIYIGAKSGSATCLGLQWEDWKETALKALKIAKLSGEDRFERLPDSHYFMRPRENLCLESPEEYTQKDFLQQALLVERLALEDSSSHVLQSNGSSVFAQYSLSIRANSQGLWFVLPATSFSHSLSLIAHSSQGSESEWASECARQKSMLSSASYIASLAKTRALEKRDKRCIPSGDYPVIFSPRCSYTLIKHIFAGLSGRAQYLQSTFLLGSVGRKILPSWVKIFDNPHLKWGAQSYPIDADGLATMPQTLVKNGVVEQYILSHYSALRLGLAPTGLASGLMNVYMTTNADNLDELLKKYPKCLLVDSVSGTGVNISQGTYSRGIEGFYYEAGHRLFPVKEATIATSLTSLYLSLEGHAADFDPLSSWKIGSLAFPSLRVSTTS